MNTAERAYDFSVRIAELVKFLREDGKRFPLDERLLGCGVAAGLAAREKESFGEAARSVKEADYLLEMATKSGYLTTTQSGRLRREGKELLMLLDNECE